MDNITMLTDHNRHFIDACRRGSWTMLEPLLSGSFSYLDSYRRRGDDWVCVHACVWPLAGGG